MYIGKPNHNIDVADGYRKLATEDENAAELLMKNGQYRQAIYFYIQAMEKYIRAQVFKRVNANLKYFRDKNKNHSIESAVDFLIEVYGQDEFLRNQIKNQLKELVIKDLNFQQLHNDLRYPYYSLKYDSFTVCDYNLNDCKEIADRLSMLKTFLSELDKLNI